MKDLVIFLSNIGKKNQTTRTPFGFILDILTSHIFLSFVLFLDCSRKCNAIPYVHKMYECFGILQDHSCHKKLTTKSIEFLMTGSVLSTRF